MNNTITIKINENERTFVLFFTTAPASYDHGGTLRFESFGKTEKGYLVAVSPDAIEWSRGRYGSGLYSFVENDDDWLLDAAIEKLWHRVLDA